MLTLRPQKDQDQPFIAHLYRSTREAELAATGWPEAQKELFAAMQLFAQTTDYRSRYRGATYELILFKKKPVGRLYLWQSGHKAHLIDISLLPEFRGQGLGRSILTDLLKAARRKHQTVTLYVAQGNPAKRLYERLGFVKIGDTGASELMEWRAG